jgi:hypothetical protein
MQTRERPPSFKTANTLHSRIESLPDGGARWVNQLMIPEAGTLKGLPDNQVVLLYRDPLKAIQSLLDRPSLANHMEFAPYRIFCPTVGGDNESASKEDDEPTSEEEEDESTSEDDDGESAGEEDHSSSDEYTSAAKKVAAKTAAGKKAAAKKAVAKKAAAKKVAAKKAAAKKAAGKKAAAEKAAAHIAAGGRPGYERRFTEMSTAEYWWRTQVIRLNLPEIF